MAGGGGAAPRQGRSLPAQGPPGPDRALRPGMRSAGRRTAASASAGLAVRPGGAPPSPYARLVLDAVDAVPAGQAATYGDIAEWTGRGSARTVGTVLSRYGREVPWWRVVQASGRPAEPHVEDALDRLRRDRCPLVGELVDLSRARWQGPPDGAPTGG